MSKREELLHVVAQLMSKRTPTSIMGGMYGRDLHKIRIHYGKCLIIDVRTDIRKVEPFELRIKTQPKYAVDVTTEITYTVTRTKLLENEICREVIRLAREKDKREQAAHKLVLEQKDNEEVTVAINNVKDLME